MVTIAADSEGNQEGAFKRAFFIVEPSQKELIAIPACSTGVSFNASWTLWSHLPKSFQNLQNVSGTANRQMRHKAMAAELLLPKQEEQ